MIKITREMVSRMGKEITGKEKGEKCNLSTFNKVKKVMDSIYAVLHEIYDLDTECTDINGVMVSFGSKKRLKLIFRNNKVEITDKSMLDEEFKGFTKYSVEKSDRFIRLMKQKVKNLKIKEFLNNVVPVLFEECKEKDDYVIDYRVDVVDKKEEEKPKTIYSINDLRKTKVKFNAVQIFGCKEESDFSDILSSLNIPVNSHCAIYKNNIMREFYSGSFFDGMADVVTRSVTNSNPVHLDIDHYEEPIELNIISNNTDKILFDIKNINNIKSINFINIRPEYNEDSDLLENEEDYAFLWKYGKFELCKKGTNLRAIHQRLEDIIKLKDGKQQPVPQIILNEYLTEQAIQTFTGQGLDMVNNYNVFKPHIRQYSTENYDLHISKPHIDNFLNLFVTLDDFHSLDDIELDLTDYDFNLNENMEGTIESKSGTYKEVIEKIVNCDWGPINQGCYCITQYIDVNNPYYPILKVYTLDEKYFTRISHIEMYINGELIKRVNYNFGNNLNPFSIYIKTFNKFNRGFDTVSSQFMTTTAIGRKPILIFKLYEKDGCIYTFNADKDEIYMNDKEKELHLCQNQLLENSHPRME